METRLSGQSDSIATLTKKQRYIRQKKKPIVTLLVVIFGSIFINIIIVIFYSVGGLWITSPAYHDLMTHVIAPNIGFVVRFFRPLVYGL